MTAGYADRCDPIEFMRARMEGCRRGGKRSGESRRTAIDYRRPLVERAIRHELQGGRYSRDTAARLGRYLDVSASYVRRITREMLAQEKRN